MKTKFIMLLSAVALLASCGGSKKPDPDPDPDPDPEWVEITDEDAYELIDKIEANRQIPDHYSAWDKENNYWASLFDRNQNFMGFMSSLFVRKDDAEKMYIVQYTKGASADNALYQLIDDPKNGKEKEHLRDASRISEWWQNNEQKKINSKDFGYKNVTKDKLEKSIEIVEETRRSHPEDPDKYGKYWFKSYDDASLEFYWHTFTSATSTYYSQQITIENNLVTTAIERSGKNDDILSSVITYDYESSVTIPEEADPGTWLNP